MNTKTSRIEWLALLLLMATLMEVWLEPSSQRGYEEIINNLPHWDCQTSPRISCFPDEKYGSIAYKNQFIDAKYPCLILNKIIYLVEYQDDGSSRNMYSQYRRALKGWDVARRSSMIHAITFKWRMRACIHYVSNSIFLHKWNFIQDSPKKLLTLFSIPLGIAINILIRLKTYRKKN